VRGKRGQVATFNKIGLFDNRNQDVFESLVGANELLESSAGLSHLRASHGIGGYMGIKLPDIQCAMTSPCSFLTLDIALLLKCP